MPEQQASPLTDLSQMSDADLQALNQKMNSGLILSPGQKPAPLAPGATKEQEQAAGEGLWKFLSQNLPMAAVGGFAGGPLGAAALGIFPPQNTSQAITSGLGFGAVGPWGKMEQAMGGMPGLVKAGARGLAGGTQYAADQGITKALGEQPENASPAGNISSVLLPMLIGKTADQIQNAPIHKQKALYANIQDTIDQLAGSGAPKIGSQMEQASGATKGVQTVLKNIEDNTKMAQIQKELAQKAQQQVPALTQQKAETIVTPQGGLDKTVKIAALDKEIDRLNKLLPEDPMVKQLNQAQSYKQKLNQGLDPFTGEKLLPGQKEKVLDDLHNLQQQAIDKITQSKTQQLQAASEKVAQTQQPPKTAQQIFDQVKADADKNPVENIYLKSLVAPNPDGSPTTARSFINNIVNSDSEHIDALYKHLKTQKKGSQMIGDIQDSLISEFLNRAYDPQTKNLTNASKLFAADGPFNKPKIEAIFGGGDKGAEKVRQFSQIVDDVRSLTELQAQSQKQPGFGSKFLRSQLIATPLGFILNWLGAPHFVAAGAAEALGSAVGFIPGTKLINGLLENPKLLEAFHSWATHGGGADAFKMNPGLSSWLDQNLHPFGK